MDQSCKPVGSMGQGSVLSPHIFVVVSAATSYPEPDAGLRRRATEPFPRQHDAVGQRSAAPRAGLGAGHLGPATGAALAEHRRLLAVSTPTGILPEPRSEGIM